MSHISLRFTLPLITRVFKSQTPLTWIVRTGDTRCPFGKLSLVENKGSEHTEQRSDPYTSIHANVATIIPYNA